MSDRASPREAGARDDAPPSVAFLLALGRALHEHGAPAHRLEEAMSLVAPVLGVDGHFLSTPTSLMLAFGEPPAQRTYLLRVSPGVVHLGKLASLNDVVGEVIGRRLAPEAARARIEAIVAERSRVTPALATFFYGVASATSARFFGAGWREVAIAFAIGLGLGVLQGVARHVRAAARLFEPSAAFLAAFVAQLAAALFAAQGGGAAPFSPFLAAVGGIVVLLPGLSLTTALTELATDNLVSGTARLAGVTITFLGIGAGMVLGTEAGEQLLHAPQTLAAAPLPAWTLYPALALSPLAIAVLFRARRRDVGWIVVSGVATFLVARVLTARFGPEAGTLVTAVLLGIVANVYGRVRLRPSAVVVVPGILMMIPGAIGVRSVSSLIQHDVVAGVAFGFTLVLAGIALAAGILIANVIVSPRRSV